MSSLITLEGVAHQYGRRRPLVLQGIDLQLTLGESVCLFGPSGSGKSTLLSIIGGRVRPSSGSVSVSGDPLWDKRRTSLAFLRRTSWVVQSGNLLPRASTLDNVALGPLARGAPAKECYERASHYLGALGLGDFEATKARLLSGGQAQRVSVARALASDTEIIIADEPTGQLDELNTTVVTELLKNEVQRGKLIILASHDVSVAHSCTRRISVVNARVAGEQ